MRLLSVTLFLLLSILSACISPPPSSDKAVPVDADQRPRLRIMNAPTGALIFFNGRVNYELPTKEKKNGEMTILTPDTHDFIVAPGEYDILISLHGTTLYSERMILSDGQIREIRLQSPYSYAPLPTPVFISTAVEAPF